MQRETTSCALSPPRKYFGEAAGGEMVTPLGLPRKCQNGTARRAIQTRPTLRGGCVCAQVHLSREEGTEAHGWVCTGCRARAWALQDRTADAPEAGTYPTLQFPPPPHPRTSLQSPVLDSQGRPPRRQAHIHILPSNRNLPCPETSVMFCIPADGALGTKNRKRRKMND